MVALAAVVVAIVLLSTGILTSAGSGPTTSTTPRVPLSTLECDALDGGPGSATSWLYGDQGALDDAFKNVTSSATLETCPDGTASPGKWHYTKTPTATAGQLACGTDSNGEANVMWTKDAKEFVALIRGSALPELLTWWQKKS